MDAQDLINSYLYSPQEEMEITEEKENMVLNELKKSYKVEINRMHIDEKKDSVYFPWLVENLKIYFLFVPGSYSADLLVFAIPHEKDSLQLLDFRKKITEYNFIQLNTEERISFLLKEGLLDIQPDKSVSIFIISNKFDTDIELMGIHWAQRLYNEAREHFKLSKIETLDFDTLGLHAAKYQFKSMIKKISNKQFTVELDECLFAFEHELYYICGAGLGGLLESLLYFSLSNYGVEKEVGKDPTMKDYIRVLNKYHLIDRRRENFIKSTFMIRNSISHYNTGFTNVDQCQMVMHGLTNSFSNIYMPSEKWKTTHPDTSYNQYLKNKK